MKKYLIIIFLIGIVQQVHAQALFSTHGKITYEKRVNMLRKFENWDDDFKENIKKYQSSNWEVSFNQSKTLYKEAKKAESNNNDMMFFSFGGGQTGQFYTDLSASTRIIKKSIQDVDYLLDDTIPQLDWKIQQEIRVIAGYECRKAIARFNDTVYAVAFYTDRIIPKGGPEGFTGLPGMILGLAIPRYATTWFATKVELLPENQLDLAAPSKGKKPDTDKEYKKMIDLYTRYDSYEFTSKQTPEQVRQRLYGLTL